MFPCYMEAFIFMNSRTPKRLTFIKEAISTTEIEIVTSAILYTYIIHDGVNC
jgi:hypothetical protein